MYVLPRVVIFILQYIFPDWKAQCLSALVAWMNPFVNMVFNFHHSLRYAFQLRGKWQVWIIPKRHKSWLHPVVICDIYTSSINRSKFEASALHHSNQFLSDVYSPTVNSFADSYVIVYFESNRTSSADSIKLNWRLSCLLSVAYELA